MNIKGARIVVTGASSGIGKDIAVLLDAAGGRVLAVARNQEAMDEAFRGTSIMTLGADVSGQAGVDQVFDHARKVLGGVDIFLANAGFAYFENSNKADWARTQAIFDLNVVSPLYAFHRLRQEKGDEPFHFAVTASAMSHLGLPGYAAYAATKAALHRFTETARFELAPGQEVMSIHPVATRTKFFAQAEASYVPWPTQDSDKVARAVVRGIRRGKKRVYPFGAFRLVNVLFSVLPLVRNVFLAGEWKKTGLAGGRS